MRDFADIAKISYVTLTRIENGISGASPAMLEKIAAALKCTLADISEPAPFKRVPSPDKGKIPYVGTINAERFNFSFDMPAEYNLPIKLDLPGERRAVALRISGDCMVNPKDPQHSLYEGDYVIIVESTTIPANGTIVVVRLNGEHTLKKIFRMKDGYELRPDNPKYESMFIESGELRMVGVFQGKYVPPYK